MDKKGTGVYKWDGESKLVGGHAVVIVGWGTLNGEDYWIIQNSWGTKSGRAGFFYIRRGTNECHIEENSFGIIPQVPGVSDIPIDNEIIHVDDEFLKNVWKIDYQTGYKKSIIENHELNGAYPRLDMKPYFKAYNFKNFVAGKVTDTRNVIRYGTALEFCFY